MERVWVGGKVVGFLDGGVFIQNVTARHIYRRENAKGIDYSLFLSLQGRCHRWELRFKDTGRVLSLPFEVIEQVALRVDTGAGLQLLVPLSAFKEERGEIQPRLL